MRGIYTASGSMLTNQARLENIGNNISNLHTPGYKRSEAAVRTFPEVLLHRTEKIAGGGSAISSPIGVTAENTAVDENYRVDTQGSLQATDRKLDFALQGEGYFAVETPQGMRYSRDGHFRLDAEGTLVNSMGFAVHGENGPVALNTEKPEVDQDGNIYQDGEIVDRLQIINADGQMFIKEGYNLYLAVPGAALVPAEDTSVSQGYLEESNADLARQMTDLVKVRRSYEAAQKTAQVYDRLLSRSANELGSLG